MSRQTYAMGRCFISRPHLQKGYKSAAVPERRIASSSLHCTSTSGKSSDAAGLWTQWGWSLLHGCSRAGRWGEEGVQGSRRVMLKEGREVWSQREVLGHCFVSFLENPATFPRPVAPAASQHLWRQLQLDNPRGSGRDVWH